jgi:hypothetical protein
MARLWSLRSPAAIAFSVLAAFCASVPPALADCPKGLAGGVGDGCKAVSTQDLPPVETLSGSKGP